MQLREVRDFEEYDEDFGIKPTDYGYFALILAVKHNLSCKQAFVMLDKELESKTCNFHNTYSRGW